MRVGVGTATARTHPTITDLSYRRKLIIYRVAATTDHDYADAQRRGNPVTLLHTETTGALSATLSQCLTALDQLSRARGSHDSTCYGLARASPRTFLAHHTAAISTAIVQADALTVVNHAAHLSFMLANGLTA